MAEHIFGDLAEWATAVVTLVSAALIVLQLQLDHERTRRENAVNSVKEWTDRQKPETAVVIRFVKMLSQEQCVSLYHGQILNVSNNALNRVLLEAAISPAGLKLLTPASAPNLDVGIAEVSHLRFITYAYLNLLESILSSWNSGIASGDILFDQFSFLRRGNASLPICRAAIQSVVGEDAFPSITNFLSAASPRPKKPLQILGGLKRRN